MRGSEESGRVFPYSSCIKMRDCINLNQLHSIGALLVHRSVFLKGSMVFIRVCPTQKLWLL